MKTDPTTTGPAQEPSDTEILDWLEANPPQAQITWVNAHSGRRWTANNCADHKSYDTLRQAVAAAMRPPATAQGEKP